MTVDKSPQKISILFKNFSISGDIPAEDVVNKPGLVKILAQTVQKDARIDLILTPGVEANIFKLEKIQDKPDRVVIDLTVPELEKKESEKRQQIKAKISEKDKIIVIDPGHGGEDPGAMGKKRTREKDVVLQISQRLQSELNGREGYRAFLTRDGDYYPSFNKRLQIAREYGADLFVSIHADAARNRTARGGSVYCLSTSGASSAAARILARNENLADIIGGAENGSKNSDETDVIMLNMIQTETINMSKTFGSIVLSNLSDVNKLKFNRIQEAPFRVLKMPHIPSVLVETAYLSNPVEEQLLKSPGFQKKISLAIADSIVDFLSSDERTRPAIMASLNNAKKKSRPARLEPPGEANGEPSGEDEPEDDSGEDTEPAATAKKGKTPAAEPAQPAASKKPAKPAYTIYSVKKGDSLDRIARRYDITLAELLRVNNMSGRGPLYVNKKLKIPTGESSAQPETKTASKKKVKERYHIVRKGDNLDKIAIRYNTSVSSLMKLNNMKKKERLAKGRKIKVSGELETDTEPDTKIATARSGKKTKQQAGNEAEGSENATGQAKIKTAYYVVKKGDTLEKIAVRNGTTIPALMKLNNMKKASLVQVGKRIKVPAGSEAETETETKIAKARAVKQTKQQAGDEDEVSESAAGQAKTKTTYYVVKKGDTLQKIAVKYKTTASELMELNNLKKGDSLNAGRKIKITGKPAAETAETRAVTKKEKPAETQPTRKEQPAETHYVVQKGDTLEKIALRNGTTIPALMKLNNMKKGDHIEAGRKISIAADPEPDATQARTAKKKEKPSDTQASKKKEQPAETHYIVQKGDTLEKIALRNGTTITALMKLNNMKKAAPIQAGRKIRIAADPDEAQALEGDKPGKTAGKAKNKAKGNYSSYVVKKGDTIEKIAAEHNTTMATLLKINNMKMTTPLLYGKTIKIPAEE